MRIALVGTRGVPARYGGFETCVEEVGARLAERGHQVIVYCRSTSGDGDPDLVEHRGMELVRLAAARRRSLETLSHTALSVAHLVARPVEAVVLFNAANAPLLPALRARGLPVATHVDGLEWMRGKWGPSGRRYYRAAESLAVRWSDALIADAQGIADYYTSEFGAATQLISYGAPIVGRRRPELLEPLGLQQFAYHLVVARFEPENHVDVVVKGHRLSGSELPLVVVGSAPYADDYTAEVHELAGPGVRFLGGVWDQDLLDQLYANCLTYQHGHSVGGTNPSLLRAMGAGAAVDAYSVSFNREVLGEAGRFWSRSEQVAEMLLEAESSPGETSDRGRLALERARRYDWEEVADGYEALCRGLAEGLFTGARPNGRRRAGKATWQQERTAP